MFRRHDADRRYLALVRGRVEHDRFEVDAPLGRSGARIGGRRRRTPGRDRPRGAGALRARDPAEAVPRRAAPIRAPRRRRAPIPGDGRYGGGGDDARALGLVRPFLHAWRIAFEHPFTGERIDLEEPLPADLEDALRRVRAAG
jgi:23S rRNA-/tRNA-specific pseudouridylate synthase